MGNGARIEGSKWPRNLAAIALNRVGSPTMPMLLVFTRTGAAMWWKTEKSKETAKTVETAG